ncbi:MAG TPA: hypothetical protein VN442_18440 [Bryobacteraceae bacterium]|nr:hypothetical protein [Bryobacteraceae bacterium]
MDQYRTGRVENAGGVAIHRAVVEGAAQGGVALPAGADVAGFAGITQEAQVLGRPVSLKRRGVTAAVAAAGVARGDYVNIADALGRMKSCNADVIAAPGPALVVHVVGKALSAATNLGDVFEMEINEFVVNRAAS